MRKIAGEINPADLYTKHLESKAKIEQLIQLFGAEFREGRPAAAPQLREDPAKDPANILCSDDCVIAMAHDLTILLHLMDKEHIDRHYAVAKIDEGCNRGWTDLIRPADELADPGPDGHLEFSPVMSRDGALMIESEDIYFGTTTVDDDNDHTPTDYGSSMAHFGTSNHATKDSAPNTDAPSINDYESSMADPSASNHVITDNGSHMTHLGTDVQRMARLEASCTCSSFPAISGKNYEGERSGARPQRKKRMMQAVLVGGVDRGKRYSNNRDEGNRPQEEGEKQRSIDGEIEHNQIQRAKSGETKFDGNSYQRQGFRPPLYPRDDRRIGRSSLVQLGEHLRGHPRNPSFVSCDFSYGSPQSSLSAAGSMGECLTDNDILTDGLPMCRDVAHARSAALRDRASTHTHRGVACTDMRASSHHFSLLPIVAQGVLALPSVGTVAPQ